MSSNGLDFDHFMKKLVKVPKAVIDKTLAKEKSARIESAKEKRKAK